jgi:hypothetical protein
VNAGIRHDCEHPECYYILPTAKAVFPCFQMYTIRRHINTAAREKKVNGWFYLKKKTSTDPENMYVEFILSSQVDHH